jgi:hypothetical protein
MQNGKSELKMKEAFGFWFVILIIDFSLHCTAKAQILEIVLRKSGDHFTPSQPSPLRGGGKG